MIHEEPAATTTTEIKPIWKCQVKGCDFSAPPTSMGYNVLTGHLMHHAKQGVKKEDRGLRLVDEISGEVLAKTLSEAWDKGLLKTGGETASPVETSTDPPQERGDKPPSALRAKEEKKDEKEEDYTYPKPSSEGVFRYAITLPADAFTLFNLAKACGLEKDGEKPFDEWVWDCIQKRFEKDYRVQLVLAPMEVE